MPHRRWQLLSTLLAALLGCGPSSQSTPWSGGGNAGAGGEAGQSSTASSDVASSTSSGSGGSGGSEDHGLCATSEHGDAIVEKARPECEGPQCEAVEVIGVTVAGDTAFACSSRRGLIASSASATGTSPFEVLFEGRCQDVVSDGDRLILSNRGDAFAPIPRLTLVAIDGPSAAHELDAIEFDGHSPESVAVVAPGLYAVAMHGDGVWLYSAGAEGALTFETQLDGFDNALALVKRGDRLYVADGPGGVRVVDVTDPHSPSMIGHVPLAGGVTEIASGDDQLYLAAGAFGVHVLDLTDPDVPALVSTIQTPGAAVDVDFDEGLLFVADWNDLRVFEPLGASDARLVGAETVVSAFDCGRVVTVDARGGDVFAGDCSGLYSYHVSPCREAADLRAPRLPIRFPRTDAGAESAYSVVLMNEGVEDLHITSIQTEGEFETVTTALTIPAGQKDFVEVRFKPSTEEAATGRLILSSDDPDEATLAVELVGNVHELGVGDPLPDWTWFPIGGTEGEQISTQALLGNVVVLSYFATF
jgi:hypothetical protein